MARDLGLSHAASVQWASDRRADSAEVLAINALGREAADLTPNLGDLPLTVITSAEHDPGLEPGGTWERNRKRWYPDWVVLQNEMAALSTNSTHITADRGGHHLNRDNPQLAAQVIADLVERVRTGAREGEA